MRIKTFLFWCVLALSPLVIHADDTKDCNSTQSKKCNNFCSSRQGFKSCIIDTVKKSGTCTCINGTTHSKAN